MQNNILSQLPDLLLLKLAQTVNGFFDRDSPTRNRLVSFAGLVITLATLHNLEVRARALVSSIFTLRPFTTLAVIILIILIAYVAVFHLKLDVVSLRRTLSSPLNLVFLLLGAFYLYVAYVQLLKVKKIKISFRFLQLIFLTTSFLCFFII